MEMLSVHQVITTSTYNNQNNFVLTKKNSKRISSKRNSSHVSLLPRSEPEREEANQKETPASQASSSVATTLGVAPAVGAQLSRVRWICLATPNPRSILVRILIYGYLHTSQNFALGGLVSISLQLFKLWWLFMLCKRCHAMRVMVFCS